MTFDISQCEIGDIVTLKNGETVVYAGFDTATTPQEPRLPDDHPKAELFQKVVQLVESFSPSCAKHWAIYHCLSSQGFEEDFIVGFADTKDKPGNQEPWKELFYIQRVLRNHLMLKLPYFSWSLYRKNPYHPWLTNTQYLAERFPQYFNPDEVHYFTYGPKEDKATRIKWEIYQDGESGCMRAKGGNYDISLNDLETMYKVLGEKPSVQLSD